MKKKVLVIEDDNDTSELVEILLNELDISVVRSSSIMGITDVREIKPDLIVLDHWIDNGLGGHFCKALKRNPSTHHIPVIMMSAISDIEQVAAEACADDFIAKPFNISDLQNVVQKHL